MMFVFTNPKRTKQTFRINWLCHKCSYIFFAFFFFINISLYAQLSSNSKLDVWKTGVRGVTAKWKKSYVDLQYLVDTLGANVIRAVGSRNPLFDEPNSEYLPNKGSWKKLNDIVNISRDVGLYTIISPRFTQFKKTIFGKEVVEHWLKDYYLNNLIESWVNIAKIYREYDNVIGYDLLNEPRISGRLSVKEYYQFIDELIDSIRFYDNNTPIIVEPPYVNKFGPYLEEILLENIDSSIIFSPHFYQPLDYTYQGIKDRPEGLVYPGCEAKIRLVEGGFKKVIWNKDTMNDALSPIMYLQKKHSLIIYIGEFSSARYASGSNKWLTDFIEIAEENNWNWTYHSYRGAYVWNAELGSNKRNKSLLKNTTRIEILKNKFCKNRIYY